MRKYCLSISMICLALSDTTVLLVPLLLTWIDDVFYKNAFLNTTIWCKLHGYMDLVSCGNSSWIIILISTERWYAVCKPWQKNTMFTNRRVCWALFVIFIFSLLAFLYFPISLGLVPASAANGTTTLLSANMSATKMECQVLYEQIYFIFGAISVLMVYVIPFFVLAFLNVMIIIKLRARPLKKHSRAATVAIRRKSTQKSDECEGLNNNGGRGSCNNGKQLTQQQVAAANSSKNERNLNITLVTLAITFMILTFPFQVYWMYENVYIIFFSNERHASNGLRDLTFKIKSLNYLINFFLYSALSKLFRQEFLAMLSSENCFYIGRLLKRLCPACSNDPANGNKASSFAEVSFSVEAFKNLKTGNYKNVRQELFAFKMEPRNLLEFLNHRKKAAAIKKKQTMSISSKEATVGVESNNNNNNNPSASSSSPKIDEAAVKRQSFKKQASLASSSSSSSLSPFGDANFQITNIILPIEYSSSNGHIDFL
jgi:hypothetical protein